MGSVGRHTRALLASVSGDKRAESGGGGETWRTKAAHSSAPALHRSADELRQTEIQTPNPLPPTLQHLP